MKSRTIFQSPRIRRSVWMLAAFVWPAIWIGTTASAGTRSADKPIAYPDKQEEWYVVKIQDTRCGFMHTFSDRTDDEIHTLVRMSFAISRAEATVEITSDQRYRETLDGRPLAFSSVMKMGQIPMTYHGTIADGKVRLVTEQSGMTRENEYDFDPEVRFAWGQLLEQRKRGLKPGTSFTIKVYEPSMKADGPVPLVLTVHEKERVDVLGKKQELYRVTSMMRLDPAALLAGPGAAPVDDDEDGESHRQDAGATHPRQDAGATHPRQDAGARHPRQDAGATPGGIEIITESWVDDEATPVISTLDMGIMKVHLYRATKQEALDPSDAPELFLNTLIHVDRTVPKAARKVTYRLTLPSDGKERIPDLPRTGMQTFRRISDREGLLTVRRIDWQAVRSATNGKPLPKGLSPFLTASATVDIDDRRIKRLARRSVSSAKGPADKADSMRKFVTDYVTDKGLDVGFATASEVARTRSGDCTEHAVLLAALARANGIPSRGVSGIVQVPEGPLGIEGVRAFGYHMWTQVYIGGQWVDIDAAMRQTDCDPTHIALAIMPLGDEGMLESIVAMFPLLGRLEIEVVEIEE